MSSAGSFPSMSDPHPAGGQPAAGAGSGGSDAESDRTRNGLRKRTPRTQRAAEPTYTRSPRRIDLDNVPTRAAAVVDQAPADVSARLTALRAGLQRGKAAPVASNGRPGQGGSNEPEVEESE